MKQGQVKNIIKTWIDWAQIENMSPEMAYILGLLWADGCVIKRKERSSGAVSLSNISEDGKYFANIFSKIGKWTESVSKQKNRKEQTTFRCYQMKFVNFLIDMDYISKSNESADKVLSFIPESLHKFWFLGLVDGDGCFYINPNNKNFKLTIASSYEQKWDYLEKLAQKLEITYRIKRTIGKMGSYSKFEITSRSGIIKFGDFIYSTKMGLPRKKDKFLRIKNVLQNSWKIAEENRGIYFHKTKRIFEIYQTHPKQKYIGKADTFEGAQKLRELKLGF